jgi:complex iron-sulfur molybdoenzyme family reductase subunit beta
MVMDLNKCIGCQTCTLACKKQWTDGDGMDYMYWNNVETQPGVGYPRGWHAAGGGFTEQRLLRPSPLPSKEDYGEAFEYDYEARFYKGRSKPVMPHVSPKFSPNWDEDVGGWNPANPHFFYLPRICNHCTHPACLEACPRKAIYKREEDGIVVIDQERCRGYRYCIKACPYKKIYYNEVTKRSEKCIFCYPRLEKGRVNACAAQCPGRIRFVGLLDDPESPVHKLVLKYRVALGLLPEKGTSPNVYYVPTINPPKAGHAGRSALEDPRLPLDYLKYLFGPEVVDVIKRLERELVRAQNGERSELLQLLIGRDDGVRYRIVPSETGAAAPSEVQEAVDRYAPGPGLSSARPTPSPVKRAFGLGVVGAAAVGLAGSKNAPCGERAALSPEAGDASCSGCGMKSACRVSQPATEEDDHGWF